jgi:hypothetical protein
VVVSVSYLCHDAAYFFHILLLRAIPVHSI